MCGRKCPYCHAEMRLWRRPVQGYITRDHNFDRGAVSLLQIMEYIRQYADNCPGDFTCVVESIGDSHEGRPIDILRVSVTYIEIRLSWIMDPSWILHARLPATSMR